MRRTMRASSSPEIRFAHSHYVTNAGIHQPWGRTTAYCYDFDMPEPIPENGNRPAPDRRPVLPQLEDAASADVTDGLSNTVFIGEHSSILSNKTWVGVVPGAVTPPRLDLRPWPSENNGGGLPGRHPQRARTPTTTRRSSSTPPTTRSATPTRCGASTARLQRAVRRRLGAVHHHVHQPVHLGRPVHPRQGRSSVATIDSRRAGRSPPGSWRRSWACCKSAAARLRSVWTARPSRPSTPSTRR